MATTGQSCLTAVPLKIDFLGEAFVIHARRKQQQVSNLWPQTICIPLINERKIIHGNLTHSNAAPFGTHVAYLN